MSLEVDVQLTLGSLGLDMEFAIDEGEVVALLGPNGAGKTTLLRAIAGLVPIDSGRIRLDDVILEDAATRQYVPTEERPIGVVFQDYLLFPHMSVLDNVAFGLRSRGTPRAEAAELALNWLERVGLTRYARSKPAGLSGGERQRVALARALAPAPRVLLLDEPLAALDVTSRAEVRRDLKRHLSSFRGLRLIVTHDPLEAVALADRLIVMEQGRHVQTGTPAEVTEHPTSKYVADLAGVNLLRGRAHDGHIELAGGTTLSASDAGEGDVFAVIHPRAVALYLSRPDGTPRNVWRGEAESIDRQGDRVRVRVKGPVTLVAEVTPAAVRELSLVAGAVVWVAVKATEVVVYPA